MDLKQMSIDLEGLVQEHIPEPSRAYDMAIGLQSTVEYMVEMHDRGELSVALDAIEALLATTIPGTVTTPGEPQTGDGDGD